MAPSTLFDISHIDMDQIQFSVEEIEAINPHRGHMRLLDGVIWANDELTEAVAFKDIRDDEFWVEGHIPGRPLFPGVLMVEAAAQLASFVTVKRLEGVTFLGFTGADAAKFRGQVVPGDRLIVLAKEIDFRPRRFICLAQGFVNGRLAFEVKITGMPF